MYLLVSTRGTVLARSPSKDFLLLRQKRIKQQSRIIQETPAQARAAFARKVKDQKARAARQRAWWARSRNQMQNKRILSSSFVEFLEYDTQNTNVKVILSGKKYTFFPVPESIFNAWTKGGATCQTDDTGKKKRWWIGKTPSLGAFFNTYIKPKYSYIKGWI